MTYGRTGRDLRLLTQTPRAEGQTLDLEIFGKAQTVVLPLAGAFQALNALAALGLALATGAARDAAAAALAKLEGVPGRVEMVGRAPSGGRVYVDFAHTPDALEMILQALRPHTQGRLSVVFGCARRFTKASV